MSQSRAEMALLATIPGITLKQRGPYDDGASASGTIGGANIHVGYAPREKPDRRWWSTACGSLTYCATAEEAIRSAVDFAISAIPADIASRVEKIEQVERHMAFLYRGWEHDEFALSSLRALKMPPTE